MNGGSVCLRQSVWRNYAKKYRLKANYLLLKKKVCGILYSTYGFMESQWFQKEKRRWTKWD